MSNKIVPSLEINTIDIEPSNLTSAVGCDERDTFWRIYPRSHNQKSIAFAAPGGTREEHERVACENAKQRVSGDVGFFSLRNIIFRNSGYVFKDNQLLTHPGAMLPYVAGLTRDGHRSDVTDPGELSIQEIEKPVVIITAEAPQIYGHWLLDYLPRLWLLKKLWKGATPQILLPNTTPRWAINIMTEYFNVSEDEILVFNPSTTLVRIKHAVIPSFLHCAHEFHSIMNNFAEYVVNICTTNQLPPKTGGQIYISRHVQRHTSNSWRRYIRNENDVMSLVQKHGYTVVCPEQLSWHDQIRVFSAARSIIGEEGSAMHNSLFAAPGSTIATLPHGSHVQLSLSALRQHPTTSLPALNAREEENSLSYDVDLDRAQHLLLEIKNKY